MTAGSLELSFQILISAISQVSPVICRKEGREVLTFHIQIPINAVTRVQQEFGLDQTPDMQERGKYAENP